MIFCLALLLAAAAAAPRARDPAEVRRVVTLAALALRIVLALGAQDRLVA